jgi:hypothetical protein
VTVRGYLQYRVSPPVRPVPLNPKETLAMPSDRPLDESITLTCVICGQPFHPHQGVSHLPRTCSTNCTQHLRMRTHSSIPPGITTDTTSTRPLDESITLTCVICGRSYHPYQGGRLSRTCSTSCAQRLRLRTRHAMPLDETHKKYAEKTCPQCQQVFTPKKRRQQGPLCVNWSGARWKGNTGRLSTIQNCQGTITL